MNIPRTANADSISYYLVDCTLQDRYRMWANSKTTAYNYGAGLGLKYLFGKNLTMNGNLTYARLQR
jgi:hypothetical protein